MTALLTIDLFHDPISRADAAELANVTVETISKWATRGYIDPETETRVYLPKRGTNPQWYLGIEVLQAERATRKRSRRFHFIN